MWQFAITRPSTGKNLEIIMSAYICNPEHFGALAAYAVENDCAVYEWQHTRQNTLAAKIDTAQRIAKGLARENIRSVDHRYPDCKDGGRPGPCLKDADIEEAAAVYAAHFLTHPQRLTPVQVFVLIQGLDYQCCETDDWPLTPAARQLDWIRNAAVRKLPGYSSAQWSYDKPIPEVEALYNESPAPRN